MSYFDSLLKKRGLEECPLPLWKLKITEEEFKDLRELLEKQTHVMSMCNNPFITLRKEFSPNIGADYMLKVSIVNRWFTMLWNRHVTM